MSMYVRVHVCALCVYEHVCKSACVCKSAYVCYACMFSLFS